ncbi:MAG: hydroxyacid dehydrogenase [Candidatus Levybacteria bacterium CG10_big_fil_rev_8_21_14_0_10_35_13]|nr:MAG: hydroxyacid dehydrogenase [Candidatus Levybacteria bacterium CG10_big_fil_rev_8_21_14_0_10_35_13]
MAKTVFFELEKWEEEYVKNSLSDTEIAFTEEKLTLENVSNYQDAQVISIFIYSKIEKEVLDKLPNLKFITTRSMGYDHIDLEYCREKEIKVAYVPAYGSHTVAEHTFSLLLAISRKLLPSYERAKKGEFGNEGLTGFDLYGKTIGILGTGNIGKNVALLSIAFGMKVLAFNKRPDKELLDKGTDFVSLDELLSASDIVSLHLPHTKETEHIINMGNITKFKKGAVLINTARGILIETQAIVEGLEKEILSAVGLDVLEEECDLREERELLATEFLKTCDLKTQLLNHVLLTMDKVIITPHNAFNSKEALHEILQTSIANIKGYIQSTPQNLVP